MTSSQVEMNVFVLPRPAAAGVIILVFITVLFTVLSLFYLATFPSAPATSLISAILWLLFVSTNINFAARDHGGFIRLLVAKLGVFSSKQFVLVRHKGGQNTIDFGYELLRRRFYYLRIPVEHITSVEVSSGQATAMMGSDMNDWHVTVWYKDPNACRSRRIVGVRDESVYLVGPSDAKTKIDEFCSNFHAFLSASGVENRWKTIGPVEKIAT